MILADGAAAATQHEDLQGKHTPHTTDSLFSRSDANLHSSQLHANVTQGVTNMMYTCRHTFTFTLRCVLVAATFKSYP